MVDVRAMDATSSAASLVDTAMYFATDPKPGQAKGTAYVTMSNSDEAKAAINTLDGTRFLKKIIKVVESKPKRLGATTPEPKPKKKKRKKKV